MSSESSDDSFSQPISLICVANSVYGTFFPDGALVSFRSYYIKLRFAFDEKPFSCLKRGCNETFMRNVNSPLVCNETHI